MELQIVLKIVVGLCVVYVIYLAFRNDVENYSSYPEYYNYPSRSYFSYGGYNYPTWRRYKHRRYPYYYYPRFENQYHNFLDNRAYENAVLGVDQIITEGFENLAV
jgi:hypothetical protein